MLGCCGGRRVISLTKCGQCQRKMGIGLEESTTQQLQRGREPDSSKGITTRPKERTLLCKSEREKENVNSCSDHCRPSLVPLVCYLKQKYLGADFSTQGHRALCPLELILEACHLHQVTLSCMARAGCQRIFWDGTASVASSSRSEAGQCTLEKLRCCRMFRHHWFEQVMECSISMRQDHMPQRCLDCSVLTPKRT